MIYAISAVFIVGYLLIAFEHVIKVNKAAVAVLTGVVCWALYILGCADHQAVNALLFESTADIAGILFFLMGAMTIVEIIDAHDGFETVTSVLALGSKRRLLWLAGLVSFFMASVLGNLTATIVMVSLLSKILLKREDLLLFSGIVIIAVNAGGAWSPIGDITTTMLWIGGQITSISIIKSLIVPSLVCMIVPMAYVSLRMQNGPAGALSNASQPLDVRHRRNSKIVFFLGIGVLLFVPVFKAITDLPPYIGMIFGLGVLWAVTEMMHRKSDEESRHAHSVAAAIQRIDMSTILFFLGILLCISGLQAAGILRAFAIWLDRSIGNIDIIVIALGLLSAIVDNVPLIAACIKMYPLSLFPQDHHVWSFLSYCVGTGGSILIIGSAAGVAAMGMAKINFFWYLRKIGPIALAGYFAGAIAFLLLNVFF